MSRQPGPQAPHDPAHDPTHEALQHLIDQLDVPRGAVGTAHVQLTYSVRDLRLMRAALVELDARRLLDDLDAPAILAAS